MACVFSGLPEWEANQGARDDDEIDVTMLAFEDAVTASWADWPDCIDLLGAKELGACNALSYAIMADVLAGKVPQPSILELLSMMPSLAWPQ